ncbi:branched-chain amino acid ABC transporter permease [Microbacterium terricola]|uniref:Branched-chain amino acid ABC transporter permease n=1 Tax=Microbacterium terricola TaxID=344163 RepID=A0ABM8E2S5_9MICO|nr:branched-chain amino acid ABC transporter permease [Microbacterium terricola]UYK40038.1 branched-chain amino acid ABC transporter permease [Microbacterium terricola]BDV32268.1 branched-chain amino acid ABC transporter permease [Microbacterium terricola]
MTASVQQRSSRVSLWSRGRIFSARNIAVAVFLVLALVFGPILLGAYWTRIMTACAIFAIPAAGIALLYGRLGLVALGQVSLMGVGGWITLRVGHATALPFELLLVIAAVGTGIIGVLVGLPALRLSGLNLAIVTLMLAGAFEVVFTVTGFPNGGEGFLGRAAGGVLQKPLPRPVLGTTDPDYFRYVLIVTAIMFVIIALHLANRPGRAWAAMRQSEAGALAAGIGTVRYRLWALAVVSATTGVAGGLLAGNAGLLDPISFKASQSILLFATVLIGGGFSLLGAAIAGFLSQGLPPLLNSIGVDGNLIFVILGLGMIQALTTAPQGIAGQLQGLARRITRTITKKGKS